MSKPNASKNAKCIAVLGIIDYTCFAFIAIKAKWEKLMNTLSEIKSKKFSLRSNKGDLHISQPNISLSLDLNIIL